MKTPYYVLLGLILLCIVLLLTLKVTDPTETDISAVSLATAVPAKPADISNEDTPAPTETPSETTSPSPDLSPTLSPTAAPVPTATPKSTALEITKSPTSETVSPGGSCQFVARAKNYTSISWVFTNPDKNVTLDGTEVSAFFGNNFRIDGLDSERITLYNIPAEMDRWSVGAVFTGKGGPRRTHSARIHVRIQTDKPVIIVPGATGTPSGPAVTPVPDGTGAPVVTVIPAGTQTPE